jgi:hypothetical protein
MLGARDAVPRGLRMRDISRHAPILQVREEMDAMKAQYEAHTAVRRQPAAADGQ